MLVWPPVVTIEDPVAFPLVKAVSELTLVYTAQVGIPMIELIKIVVPPWLVREDPSGRPTATPCCVTADVKFVAEF